MSLPASPKRFWKLEKITSDASSQVYKAKDLFNGSLVTLKKVHLLEGDDEYDPTIRELALLNLLQSPHLVKLQSVDFSLGMASLAFEYLPYDLGALLQQKRTNQQALSKFTQKSYMQQMLSAIQYCHAHHVMHRDLKPQSFFLTEDGKTLKLGEFGLATAYATSTEAHTQEVVTLWYRPPELLLGADVYGPAIDMWSLGCIMAELVTLNPIFKADSEIDLLFKIFRLLGTPTEASWAGVSALADYSPVFPMWPPQPLGDWFPLSADGIHLMQGLLQYNPLQRLDAGAALQHPYLRRPGATHSSLVPDHELPIEHDQALLGLAEVIHHANPEELDDAVADALITLSEPSSALMQILQGYGWDTKQQCFTSPLDDPLHHQLVTHICDLADFAATCPWAASEAA